MMDNFAFRSPLVNLLSENWWLVLLRGIAALVFGVVTWCYPLISIFVMVLLFGAYAFVDGILGIIVAIKGLRNHEDWWLLLVLGVVSLIAGVVTFYMPSVTWLAVVMFIAVWALVSGLLQVVTAFRLRKSMHGEWWMILGGVLSVLFGVVLMINPIQGGIALTWLIGIYALLFGVVNVVLALRVRQLRR